MNLKKTKPENTNPQCEKLSEIHWLLWMIKPQCYWYSHEIYSSPDSIRFIFSSSLLSSMLHPFPQIFSVFNSWLTPKQNLPNAAANYRFYRQFWFILICKLPCPISNLAKSFFIHVILHLSLGCRIFEYYISTFFNPNCINKKHQICYKCRLVKSPYSVPKM